MYTCDPSGSGAVAMPAEDGPPADAKPEVPGVSGHFRDGCDDRDDRLMGRLCTQMLVVHVSGT